MKQEMAYFDTTTAGALISHLAADADKVLCLPSFFQLMSQVGSIRDLIPSILTPVAHVIYGGYVLFSQSWKLSLVDDTQQHALTFLTIS